MLEGPFLWVASQCVFKPGRFLGAAGSFEVGAIKIRSVEQRPRYRRATQISSRKLSLSKIAAIEARADKYASVENGTPETCATYVGVFEVSVLRLDAREGAAH